MKTVTIVRHSKFTDEALFEHGASSSAAERETKH